MTERTLTHTSATLKNTWCAVTLCAPHTTPLYGVWGVVCAVTDGVSGQRTPHTKTHTKAEGTEA